jgi:hypothetical protein
VVRPLAQGDIAALVTLISAVRDNLPEAIPIVLLDDVDVAGLAALSPAEPQIIRDFRRMGLDPLPEMHDAGRTA